MPVNPPISAAMFVMVARSSTLSSSMASLARHASPLNQELDCFSIRSNDAGKSANLGCHVRHGCPFIDAEFFDGLSRVLDDLRQGFSAAHVVEAKNLQNEVFRSHIGSPCSPNQDLGRLRHPHPNILGEPGIENVSRSDSKCDTSNRPGVRRVRIRANHQLAGKSITLENNRVADAFRSFAVGQLTMRANALALGKFALLELELGREIKQTHLALLLRQDFIKECQVVAKKQNR